MLYSAIPMHDQNIESLSYVDKFPPNPNPKVVGTHSSLKTVQKIRRGIWKPLQGLPIMHDHRQQNTVQHQASNQSLLQRAGSWRLHLAGSAGLPKCGELAWSRVPGCRWEVHWKCWANIGKYPRLGYEHASKHLFCPPPSANVFDVKKNCDKI